MTESQAARLVSTLLTQANVAGKLPVAWRIAGETWGDWPTDAPTQYHGYASWDRTEVTFAGPAGSERFRIRLEKMDDDAIRGKGGD